MKSIIHVTLWSDNVGYRVVWDDMVWHERPWDDARVILVMPCLHDHNAIMFFFLSIVVTIYIYINIKRLQGGKTHGAHPCIFTYMYIHIKHLPTWLHPVIINHHKPNLLWTHLQPATSHVRWHLSRHASSGSQSSIGPSVGGPKAPLWLEKKMVLGTPSAVSKQGAANPLLYVIICYYHFRNGHSLGN